MLITKGNLVPLLQTYLNDSSEFAPTAQEKFLMLDARNLEWTKSCLICSIKTVVCSCRSTSFSGRKWSYQSAASKRLQSIQS